MRDPVPPAVADGWRRLDEQYPADARRLRKLAADPWPLVDALQAGPQTFIHSDWKLGNLGREGSRTILLDWDRTGEAPPLVDLAWYLAVNCDRLPESKEDTIDAYRAGARVPRASRPGRGGPASSLRRWQGHSCSWPGPRPATRPSSDGGASVSPHGIPDQPNPATPTRASQPHGLGVQPRCTTSWRRSPSRASRTVCVARACSTSAPGPARCAVRYERRERSRSPSTCLATCSA